MNVPSPEFLAFAAVAAALLALSRRARWRRFVLFVANLAFLATFARGALSLVPFAGFLAAGYLAMKICAARKDRPTLYACLAVLVAGFCWIKGYAFVPHAALLPDVFVTVGLSYVFFRVLSVVVDASQDALPHPIGVAGYVNYALNFTTLVAGPIQFYRPFVRDEVDDPPAVTRSAAARACERIVAGFLKVVVLSPVLLYAHQRAIAAASLPLILAMYPIYLYVNFSGYTDVAIGTARFLRLELPENFDYPFLARGYIEFWNRWHMSLSAWFKTYVYSPMLLWSMRRFPGRRVEAALGVAAYFATFFLVGIWHGQTWTFVVFGLLNGAGVSGNKIYQLAMDSAMGKTRHRSLMAKTWYQAACAGATFLWFALTLVFFWAAWPQLGPIFGRFNAAAWTLSAVALVAGGAAYWRIVTLALAFDWKRFSPIGSYVRPAWYAALAMAVVSIEVIFNAPAAHVVYRAF